MGQHYIGRKDGPLNMCLVVCDDCLETIKKSLTPEKQKDSGEGYICDYCGKLFKNPQALKTHLRWCKEKPEIDGDQEIESKEPDGAGDE